MAFWSIEAPVIIRPGWSSPSGPVLYPDLFFALPLASRSPRLLPRTPAIHDKGKEEKAIGSAAEPS